MYVISCVGQGRRSRTVADISDASTFLKLSNLEKRAILRASGLTQLPRPREVAPGLPTHLNPHPHGNYRSEC